MLNIFKKKKNQQEDKKEYVAPPVPHDIVEKDFSRIYELCRENTMTSPERMYCLYKGVKYILDNAIPGDFIECGVWKGGSAMLIAKLLSLYNVTNRKIILYDTYEGMSEPSELDRDYTGEPADSLLKKSSIEDQASVWCYSSFEEVKENISKTGIDPNQVHMIKGKVEDTIPSNVPAEKIALLRLDTDWYESTYHELVHLYPMLVEKGVLIIDDYGHWEGCRRAVDQYFAENNVRILLNRIDETGRIAIKTT